MLPVLALVALAWAEAPECPEGAVTAPLHEAQVRILAIGAHDPDRLVADTLVSTSGRFTRTDLVGDCWQRGWFEQPNGERSYFTQVAVVEEPACPEDARRSGPIQHGTWLEVTALHPRDAHFDDVDQLGGDRYFKGLLLGTRERGLGCSGASPRGSPMRRILRIRENVVSPVSGV